MEKKRIHISVGPSVIILAILVVVGLYLFQHRSGYRTERGLSIDDTPVIATRIRVLGELTTACFYDEIIISDTKDNALSSSQLGSLAKEKLGKDLDDHLVIIARGTVRAGIDLRRIDGQDIRFAGDTVVVRLPYPQYLDIIINPSDYEVFAESGRWTQQQFSSLQESARRRLLFEAEEAGLLQKAYDGAVDAISGLLTACGYTCIRFDHPGSQLRMPVAPPHLQPR